MIGCILFTVGTLSIYSVYKTGESSRFYTSQHIKAIYLASGVLNQIESKDYEDIVSSAAPSLKDFEDFSINIEVAPLKIFSNSKERGKIVTVNVSYDIQGSIQTYSLTSQFFNYQ